MKKNLLLTFLLLTGSLFFTLKAQGICDPAANVIIYSNYDGGDFTINIDENIPNIRIGLCSYEDLHVTISGTYAANVVEVLYAGYNSDGTTSVTGVDAGIVSILNYPPVTLFDADGYNFMICAYECDTDYVPGGCNTVDQAADYFLTYLDGNIRYSQYQYSAFTGTFTMSLGGNCCYGATDCVIEVGAGQDADICVGDSVQLKGSGALNYSWTPNIALSDAEIAEPYASPTTTTTYILFGTDADGCGGTDTVTIFVNPLPTVTVTPSGTGTLTATGGGTYQWYFMGEIIDGATNAVYEATENGYYSVEVTSDAGCVTLSEEVLMQPVGITTNSYINQFVTLFPNPATDVININTNSIIIIDELIIYNVSGQAVKTISNGNSNQINVEMLPAGLYTIKLITNKGLITKQIILE